MNHMGSGCGGLGWIRLVHAGVHWRGFVNTVWTLGFHRSREYLDESTIIFCRKVLRQRISVPLEQKVMLNGTHNPLALSVFEIPSR